MVSLGKEISAGEYSGEVDPLYMHLPFFIGIYHTFMNFCISLRADIEAEEQRSRSTIADSQQSIYYENSKSGLRRFADRILGTGSNVDYLRRVIASANDDIQSNREKLAHYKKLMNAVSSQMLRDSVHFKMFEDGVEKDFDASESFEL